jgi:hypothetical protein
MFPQILSFKNMAAGASQSLHTSNAWQHAHTKTSECSLFNKAFGNPATSKNDDPSTLHSAQAPPYLLEGYMFVKADPLPDRKPLWERAERISMAAFSQEKLGGMMFERLLEASATVQYNTLGHTRRAHIDRLLVERRRKFPNDSWTCAYAKKYGQSGRVRHATEHAEETVAMEVILMVRPQSNRSYPLSPVGEVVDLRYPLAEADSQSRSLCEEEEEKEVKMI